MSDGCMRSTSLRAAREEVRQEAGGEPTGVQALCDGGGVDQVALTQATCDVGVDVTEFNLPRQHVGVLQQEGKGEVKRFD